MSFLEVKNIRKSFGDLEVLKGISFSLEKGEILSIIGSSGGGKTTLLRCLNSLETPDSGEVLVDGKPAVRDQFGLVFQNFNLFPQYTAFENVTLAPRLRNLESEEEINAAANSLLAKVGLSDKADSYPCQLSGGQQQRVAIARALAMSPDILCFDEPTSALDPELTGEVLKVIRSLKSKDSTMIVVTHEMEFAKSVSDKIIFMYGGEIVEAGDTSIFDNPKTDQLKSFLKNM